jgi:hypothetical protein
MSMVKVPDARLDRLHVLYPTGKKTPATIEYVDVAGLGKGATQRKGFQDQFLGNVKNVDALLCVIRAFENDAVPHPEGSVDPQRDWRIIEDEFMLSDMAILDNRIQRLSKDVKKVKDARGQAELEVCQKCYACLEEERPLRELDLSDEEAKLIKGFQFLTEKPVLIVLNIGEGEIAEEVAFLKKYAKLADGKNKVVVVLSANLEMEISQLPDEDKAAFQEEMGIKEPALNKMIRHSYNLLGLMSYFTAGEKEVRAWTIKKNTRAQSAAGEIHSDIERGFIRAEVVPFETLSELTSLTKCKDQGVLRLEGKEYIVQDGDVITFRFNV